MGHCKANAARSSSDENCGIHLRFGHGIGVLASFRKSFGVQLGVPTQANYRLFRTIFQHPSCLRTIVPNLYAWAPVTAGFPARSNDRHRVMYHPGNCTQQNIYQPGAPSGLVSSSLAFIFVNNSDLGLIKCKISLITPQPNLGYSDHIPIPAMSEIRYTEAVLKSLHGKVVVLTGWSTLILKNMVRCSRKWCQAELKALVLPQSSSSSKLVRISSSEIGLQRRVRISSKP